MSDPKTTSPKLQTTQDWWDERYSDEFASYGTAPNDFVRAVAGAVPAGPVLVIAAGEGRDAVFMAERGHRVVAMDLSSVGLANANALARKRGVTIETQVADLADFDLGVARWSGIIAIWAHLPPALRTKVHRAAVVALKPGGALILEAYSPKQLERPGVGGPPNAELLLTPEDASTEFAGLDLVLCQEAERVVAEGRFHQGPSTTTQLLGIKPKP